MFQERLRRAQQPAGPGQRLPASAASAGAVANNPLDPYDHMVRGQPPRYPHPDMNQPGHVYSPVDAPGSRPLSHSSSPATTPFSTPPSTPQSAGVYPGAAPGMPPGVHPPQFPVPASNPSSFNQKIIAAPSANPQQVVAGEPKAGVELPHPSLPPIEPPVTSAPHEEMFDDLLGKFYVEKYPIDDMFF